MVYAFLWEYSYKRFWPNFWTNLVSFLLLGYCSGAGYASDEYVFRRWELSMGAFSRPSHRSAAAAPASARKKNYTLN